MPSPGRECSSLVRGRRDVGPQSSQGRIGAVGRYQGVSSGGEARAGATGGGWMGSPRWTRIFATTPGSVRNASTRRHPPNSLHRRTSMATNDELCHRRFWFSARQPRPRQPASERARERHADLERPKPCAFRRRHELAPDELLAQYLRADELGKRDSLAEERGVSRTRRRIRDSERGLLERGVAVATNALGIGSRTRRDDLGLVRRFSEELVEPAWQIRHRHADRPAIPAATPMERRRDDDLAAGRTDVEAGAELKRRAGLQPPAGPPRAPNQVSAREKRPPMSSRSCAIVAVVLRRSRPAFA